MTNWLGLNKKVVIVTGGSSGIGHAIVKELLEQGAVVYNADLNNNNINNENYHYFYVDVTNKSSVKQVVDNIFNTEKKIDVLVNNAGINLPRTLIDSKEEHPEYEINESDLDKMFAVNLKGPLWFSQAALIGFTRSWAKELGKYNINVVAIAPGIIEETGLRTKEYEKALSYSRNISVDQLNGDYSKSIPIKRVGKLTEIADLVCYLSSDRSSYITGTTINISGGKSRG